MSEDNITNQSWFKSSSDLEFCSIEGLVKIHFHNEQENKQLIQEMKSLQLSCSKQQVPKEKYLRRELWC